MASAITAKGKFDAALVAVNLQHVERRAKLTPISG
jgi:hypothetical protein